jgi:hypothetical protein
MIVWEKSRETEREIHKEREKTRTCGLLPIAFQCPTIVYKEGNSLVISLANIVRDGCVFSLDEFWCDFVIIEVESVGCVISVVEGWSSLLVKCFGYSLCM